MTFVSSYATIIRATETKKKSSYGRHLIPFYKASIDRFCNRDYVLLHLKQAFNEFILITLFRRILIVNDASSNYFQTIFFFTKFYFQFPHNGFQPI